MNCSLGGHRRVHLYVFFSIPPSILENCRETEYKKAINQNVSAMVMAIAMIMPMMMMMMIMIIMMMMIMMKIIKMILINLQY